MKFVLLIFGGLVLSSCGLTGGTQAESLTVGEVMARCTAQFCRVFNSTQVGRDIARATQITVFVPVDSAFSAYLTRKGVTLENFLGTPEGEALVKAHTTMQAISFPVPQEGATLRALDGRVLEVKAVNASATQYTVSGIFVLPAGNEGGSVITNGSVLDIQGVIQ